MGQLTSSEASDGSHIQNFTTEQIRNLFETRIPGLISKGELSSMASKVNMKDLDTAEAVLTFTDLGAILNLEETDENVLDPSEHITNKDPEIEEQEDEINNQSKPRPGPTISPFLEILYRSFTVLGRLPFLATPGLENEQLTIKKLIVALAVHLGRVSKIWTDFDYLKVLFISLAVTPQSGSTTDLNEKTTGLKENSKSPSVGTHDEKRNTEAGPSRSSDIQDNTGPTERKIAVEVLQAVENEDEDPKITSRRIKWNKFEPLLKYDGLDVNELSISSFDLAQILALLLVVNSIPDQSHATMQHQLHRLVSKKWVTFENASFSLLRFFNIEITRDNCKDIRLSYDDYKYGMESAMDGFMALNFKRLLKVSLSSSVDVPEPERLLKTEEKKNIITRVFTPTRLVDEATISIIALFMKSTNTNFEITPQNMVELYNGAQSGFSIRSLELKIFKWQAPTILLVSGKRLRSKTITKNKRYQQFDSEYPRYFRSSEDPKKNWQNDTDKITYAVFIKEPWRNSNKSNFGDEETAFIAILPRYDFFKSKRGLLSAGKLIYFNNQGMGVGFGNEQPVNKNNTRKYLPGSVSLTIEANLEFGVFRHIVNAGANTPRYFETSSQKAVSDQDYEDRFVITDLEVWGVGSTKELDEQRKQWEWEEKQALARQGVNLRNLGEERAFLEMAGLVGNQGSGGSV